MSNRKKTVIYLALITFILLFFLRPLFGPGFFSSHDGELHAVRIAAYYKSLKDGQIPPRWAGDLNYRYGHPDLIFMPPLPSFIGSLIYTLRFSLYSTLKILFGASLILSGLLMYFFLKESFKNNLPAFVGAIFYTCAPYRLVDIYVRGALGEALAFIFPPLILLFLTKYFLTSKKSCLYLSAISFSLFILTHNITALMFSPVIFLYFLFFLKKEKNFAVSLLTFFILSFCLAAFYWFPALIEQKHTYQRIFASKMFLDQFPKIKRLFYSDFSFGTMVNAKDGLSPMIGIFHWIVFFVSLLYLFLSQKKPKIVVFSVVVFLTSLFFTQPISKILWQHLPLLKYFQFPWRLLFLSVFSASTLAAAVIKFLKPKKIIVLVLILGPIIWNLNFVKVKSSVQKEEDYYFNFKSHTALNWEATTIWSAGGASNFPAAPVQVVSGNVKIKDYQRKSNLHLFTVEAFEDSTLVDNTLYFPGWRVFVDGQKVTTNFQDPNWRGLITFPVKKGTHQIKVKFGESPVRFGSNIVSFSALMSLFFLGFLNTYNRFTTKKC